MKTVNIGAGQGFYGDSLLPVLDVARFGNVKYISFDTLAELTLAILEKGRKKDPDAGYPRDVVPMMRNLLPICRERGIRLVTNAGGINPPGAARAVAQVARELGMPLKIAVVTGDNVEARLPELVAKHQLTDKESGRSLGEIADKALFSSVYLGADVIRQALDTGADVVITGRTTDTAQFLGPVLHEFGWQWDDWDRIAQGIVLGHLMECSGQVTGGNLSVGWEEVPDLEHIGYPVAEVSADGSFILTKPPGTGGRVNLRTVKEQFLYEIHDPRQYITPDVICDFTTTHMAEVGPDQVRVWGTRGRARPETLKGLVGYQDGWMGEGFVTYSWPNAVAKARRAEHIVRRRLEMQGVHPAEIYSELIGLNSLHMALAPEPDLESVNEVRLRMAIRTYNRADCEVLAREFPPLLLSGPPTGSGLAGTPAPRELLAMASFLVPREEIYPHVRISVEEVR